METNANIQTPQEDFRETRAKVSKDLLLTFLNESNIQDAYSFLSDAFAHAIMSPGLDDEDTRKELSYNYFALKGILEKCAEFKEAHTELTYKQVKP